MAVKPVVDPPFIVLNRQYVCAPKSAGGPAVAIGVGTVHGLLADAGVIETPVI
jgi:hypothetical protein